MLFDKKERTRTEPKRAGESDFAFYDSTGRPEFQVYRDLVNGWVAELPQAERDEMVARLRKSDSLGYQAALAELAIHAALVRRGYTIEIHPPCEHPTRKPDFLAKDKDGKPVAYIEVTTFGPAQEQVTQSNREATIYNAIDKTKLPPGFRLTYDVESYGKGSPSTGDLCKEIESWAINVHQDDPEIIPTKLFETGDWKIEIGLIGGFKKDGAVERSIGGAIGDIRRVKPQLEIREALKKKGSRYGTFAAPYAIVIVDCKGELTGGDRNADALVEAAFGTVFVEVATYGFGEREIIEKRRNDGYFGWRDKPQHQNVSAAILMPKPHLWDLRNDRWQPLLLKNPWASHEFPDDVLPLPGCQYLTEKDEVATVEGKRFADFLGLPAVWPPYEQ
jgi:hypothetical protein